MTTPGFGVGRHRRKDDARSMNDAYEGKRRAKIAPVPRPAMGQPIPRDLMGSQRSVGSAKAQTPAPQGPARHGGQKAVGALRGGTMRHTPQHAATVKSQTKRDRATRRESQRKAGGAIGGMLRAFWALGKS